MGVPSTEIATATIEHENRVIGETTRALEHVAKERELLALFDEDHFALKLYPVDVPEEPREDSTNILDGEKYPVAIRLEPTERQKNDPQYAYEANRFLGMLEGTITWRGNRGFRQDGSYPGDVLRHPEELIVDSLHSLKLGIASLSKNLETHFGGFSARVNGGNQGMFRE